MTKLKDNYFEIKRAGINTTFQDNGRKNLNHIGIPISGAMDKRNFMLANALLKNEINTPVIEFAYQGPLLEFNGDRIYFVITGNVKFEIIKNNKEPAKPKIKRFLKFIFLLNGKNIKIIKNNGK